MTRAIGNTSGEVVCLLNLGATCELLNKLDKAIEWHTLVRNHDGVYTFTHSVRLPSTLSV